MEGGRGGREIGGEGGREGGRGRKREREGGREGEGEGEGEGERDFVFYIAKEICIFLSMCQYVVRSVWLAIYLSETLCSNPPEV